MSRSEPWNRLASLVGLSLILTVVPACTATAGHGLFRRPATGAVVAAPPAQGAPYVAYRPVYPVPGTRPLFLSNYAGANYPSVAPGAVVTPTEFRMITGRSARTHWSWFGPGW